MGSTPRGVWKIDDWLVSGRSLEDLLTNHTRRWEDSSSFAGEWPTLAEEALYGPAGELVRKVGEQSEASIPGLLLPFLVAFGNLIGRGAHWKVEGDKHFCRINAVLVGPTSLGRKGTGSNRVVDIVAMLEPEWKSNCWRTGLSSGEGLIHAVRDPVYRRNKKGELELLDEGVTDKRLVVEEPEFAGPLNVMRRDGNTLSAVLRNSWDDKQLAITTRNNPEKATHSHVSILGHITDEELLMHLTSKKLGGGIGDRFLFALTRRSKKLPFGGAHVKSSEELFDKLLAAAEFGKESKQINLSAAPESTHGGVSARELWEAVYEELSEGRPGLFGSVTSRAEAYTRRLATLYAVLDCSEWVCVDHLLAGLAVWQYCEDSARIIFGDKLGDEVADEILGAIEMAEGVGITRTEISDLFSRNENAAKISPILTQLENRDLIVRVREKHDGPGRPVERFFPR